MNQKLDAICREVQKALTGKQAVVEKVLMAMLCGGHILLDDVPGVGKTTLAVAFSKALGLRYRRIQFTPDVLPSDIVGFSMYDKQQNAFRYVPGIVSDANLLLGDEINRTSSKTQSALLEAMEEKQVTVDGICYPLPDPFCVIATQNQVGTAGTQPLPKRADGPLSGAAHDRVSRLREPDDAYPRPAAGKSHGAGTAGCGRRIASFHAAGGSPGGDGR